MSKKNKTIDVNGTEITVLANKEQDSISLTDIAKSKGSDSRAADIIKNWIRNRGTIEFIGTWEKLYNPDFKVVEFDHFKMNAGLPSFVLSPGGWMEKLKPLVSWSRKENMVAPMPIKILPLSFVLPLMPPLNSF